MVGKHRNSLFHLLTVTYRRMCLHVSCEQVTLRARVVAVVAHELSLHVLRHSFRSHFDDFFRRVHIDWPYGFPLFVGLASLFLEVVHGQITVFLGHSVLVALTHDQHVVHLWVQCVTSHTLNIADETRQMKTTQQRGKKSPSFKGFRLSCSFENKPTSVMELPTHHSLLLRTNDKVPLLLLLAGCRQLT